MMIMFFENKVSELKVTVPRDHWVEPFIIGAVKLPNKCFFHTDCDIESSFIGFIIVHTCILFLFQRNLSDIGRIQDVLSVSIAIYPNIQVLFYFPGPAKFVNVRFPGVLQRLALTYFIVALIQVCFAKKDQQERGVRIILSDIFHLVYVPFHTNMLIDYWYTGSCYYEQFTLFVNPSCAKFFIGNIKMYL